MNFFEFIEDSLAQTFLSGDVLITAIRREANLAQAVLEFPRLSVSERVQVMKRVFELEVGSSGLAAPELVLDSNAKRSTFFEFDTKNPGPGRVILNPLKLFADTNPYAALLFLIHETRHSYQFQLGFAHNGHSIQSVFKAYRSGFEAQQVIFEQARKVSFCDFLTLNQEYEAFLFGNYVMEILTNGLADTSDMGTLASQFVPGVGLRLDLPKLAKKVGPHALLKAFNELEKVQYHTAHP